MGNNEEAKKKSERKCLNIAIQNLLSQGGFSKRIGKLLSGNDVERQSEERPDFIRYVSSANNGRGMIVGIEHFRVDHISNMTKNNKYQSLGIIHQKRTHAYYDKWHEEILNSESIPDISLSEMCGMLSKHFDNAAYATIHTFISSFKQAIDTHMESIDEYARAIKYESNKRKADHRLVILIEVHSAFRNLFFHNNNKIHYENTPVCLVLDEFIQLLEKADKRVNYYIFNFTDTLEMKTKTVAINAKDIRGSLHKQHIPVYHYCGADLYLPNGEAFVKDYHMEMQHETNGKEITFKAFPSMSIMRPEYKLKFIYNALRIVYFYYAKKEPIILDLDVERILEIFAPFIIDWRKCQEDNWSYEPVFLTVPSPDYVDKAFKAFSERWRIGDTFMQDADNPLCSNDA